MMKEYWQQRYLEYGYAYGKAPNAFFKQQLQNLPPGKVLLPADGEGRNGAFAASQDWNVTSFDISENGQQKALNLCEEIGVSIDYRVGAFEVMEFTKEEFDVIALIFAHLPGSLIKSSYQLAGQWLKTGGHIILEAFSERHLEYRQKDPAVGGPQDLDMLFSIEKVKTNFPGYKSLYLQEEEVELHEGKYHNGFGSVIRFVGQKT